MESAPDATTIINGRQMDYFCGTAYLALQGHPDIVKAACDATRKFGIGSATSRSGFGNNPVLLEVERNAAQFFDTESALYYVSGYMGNTILLQGLKGQCDVIFADEQSHYAVKDGVSMLGKKSVTFAHCDANDLAEKIRQNTRPGQKPLVITDGIFPTTGAISPLACYSDILRNYEGSTLCVDDAHASGVIGDNGRGTLEYCRIQSERCYATHTLSKAFGGHGGIITGTAEFINHIKCGSKIPIASNSVPTPAAAASAKALEMLVRKPEIRSQLWENVAYVKNAFRKMGFSDIQDTPVPIVCLHGMGVNFEAIQRILFDKGIAVFYLSDDVYTNVPSGGVIRIAIFSSHSKSQLDRLISEIGQLL